jgi:hypothetical protein
MASQEKIKISWKEKLKKEIKPLTKLFLSIFVIVVFFLLTDYILTEIHENAHKSICYNFGGKPMRQNYGNYSRVDCYDVIPEWRESLATQYSYLEIFGSIIQSIFVIVFGTLLVYVAFKYIEGK